MAINDDYTSDKNTSGVLTPGSQASGVFEQRGDSDWFRISLAANTYYTFKLTLPTLTGYSYYDYALGLSQAQGAYVSPSATNAYGTELSTVFKSGLAGDYYFSATNNFGSLATAYTVSATAGAADAVGDTTATASSLTLGISTSGAFEGPSDLDVYKVALTAGTIYNIKPAMTNGNGVSVSLTDANGQYVATSSSVDGYSFVAAASGNYYLTLSGNSTSTGAAADYTVLMAAGPDDYAASAAGAGRLAIGGSTPGKIDAAGDKDWYAVSLNANTTYWFTAKPGASGAYSSSYTQLKLYDSSSQVMASQTGSNSQAVLQFVPSKTGTYYFEVGDSTNYYLGNYVASAVIGTRDDYGSDKASAAPLSLGSTLTGSLELASDKDVFKFAVKAGTTYTFELKGQNPVGSPSLYMSGADANGSSSGFVSYAKTGVTDYRVYTANYTGDYYLTVANNYSSGTSGYTLQVNAPSGDDFAASSATTGLLATGGKLAGALNFAGDSDWIKVKLVAGTKYAFVLEGKASGAGTLDVSGSDVVMSMVSSSGYSSYLTTLSGLSGKGYSFAAEVTGDYYLTLGASPYYGSAPSGSYTISSYNLSGDTAMPTVLSFAPGNGSKGASLTGNITLTFDDLIRTGDSLIRLIDAQGNVVENYSSSSSRMQITGKVVTIDPSANLQPGTKYTLELQAGSLMDYAGNKFLADRVYSFTTLDTVAQGGSGNDVLSGIGTNIRLSGGDGVDVVVYGNSYANYTVTRGATETKVLFRNAGSLGTGDSLTGVERLQFADRNIALDVDGNGGQTYRLYQAAFNRTPDKGGLGYWMSQMDQGMGLKAVADAFLSSPEFQNLYGANSSNEVFIDNLYRNVLHRAGDAEGIKNWNYALNNGVSRADLLAGFSESSEYVAEIIKVIGNGFEYTPYG
jgi:methionine-rich copper-binding protein CopC